MFGVIVGGLAGYYRGPVEIVLMRVTEFFQIIPAFVLLMVLVAFLQPSLESAVIGIALITWPQVARVVRGEFLTLRSREFVEAARTLGASGWQTFRRVTLPAIRWGLTYGVVLTTARADVGLLTSRGRCVRRGLP